MYPTISNIVVEAPAPSASLASALNKFHPILFGLMCILEIFRLTPPKAKCHDIYFDINYNDIKYKRCNLKTWTTTLF